MRGQTTDYNNYYKGTSQQCVTSYPLDEAMTSLPVIECEVRHPDAVIGDIERLDVIEA